VGVLHGAALKFRRRHSSYVRRWACFISGRAKKSGGNGHEKSDGLKYIKARAQPIWSIFSAARLRDNDASLSAVSVSYVFARSEPSARAFA
jgi:hypothetical protein